MLDILYLMIYTGCAYQAAEELAIGVAVHKTALAHASVTKQEEFN